MPCVLAVLRRERGALPFSKREWLEAIMLAEQERVAPAFALAARQTGLTLPEAIDTALQETERAATLETFLWVAELKGLLAAFTTAHIAVLPLKGPFFAQRVYGGSALRPCRDLDLLVRAADLRRAEALLHELGFRPAIHADDYHQSWTRRTTNVELHFDVEHPLAFNFDIAAVWRRAVSTEFEGVPAWRMEPVDELIFLGLHGVRHRFDRLGLVLDIHRMLESCPDLRTAGMALIGRGRELADVLLLGLLMAGHLAGTDAVPAGADPGALRHLQPLAAKLWHQLLESEPAKLDWRTQHQFFLELERTATGRLRRRIRHGLILLTRLIEDDYRFAARFGLRRHWQVWLLRPARLISRQKAQ